MSWSCDATTSTMLLSTYQGHGAMFVSTVSALLAAQCTLLDPDQWPRDRTDDVLKEGEFDFVVVGAGAAGAVVANRLSEVPDWTVLLVEAGGDPHMGTEIPALFFNNVNTSIDWGYRVEPQVNACLGYVDRRCYWPRAKILGGCTSINAMFYVRGNHRDYDEWEEQGNPGWAYDDVLPYFKKSQNIEGGDIDEIKLEKYHGRGGYLQTEIQGSDDILEEVIIKANVELGLRLSTDVNSESQMGVARGFNTIKNGRRMSTARAFLSPIKDRKNLYVMKDTLATKILFHENSNKVNGIVLRQNGVDINIKVRKEVIVSGGSVNSPQLLLLSGIGPKNDLMKLGIEVKKNLPVGHNLQDHVFVPMFYTFDSENDHFEDQVKYLHDYILKREGPLTSLKPNRIVSFINTKDNKSEFPDIQQHFVVYDYLSNEYHRKHHFGEEIQNLIKELNKNKTIITVYNTLLRPESKGQVKLRSINPMDYPLIYANYFSDSKDLDTITAGMQHTIRLGETDSFRRLGIKLEWINLKSCRKLDRTTEDFLKCWAREMTTTLYHPAGSMKMGPAEDKEAVVDNELTVHGIEGLRVIDASIMPNVVRGNTQAPTIMIGEKGSDMIKAQWLQIKEEL